MKRNFKTHWFEALFGIIMAVTATQIEWVFKFLVVFFLLGILIVLLQLREQNEKRN